MIIKISNQSRLSPVELDAEVLKAIKPAFRVDVEQLSSDIPAIRAEVEKVATELSELGLIAPNSPKKVIEWLKAKGIQVPVQDGKPTTSVEALYSAKIDTVHEVAVLIAFRSKSKLLQAAEKLLSLGNANEVITPTISTESATGRVYMSDPNPLNIGSELRKYILPIGTSFIKADYKCAELRMIAAITGDLKLASALSGDPHSYTAASIMNVSEKEVTNDHRQIGKILNFGISYGMQPGGVVREARKLGVDVDKKRAISFIEAWFDNFSAVQEYLNMVDDFPTAEIKTWAGRTPGYEIEPKSNSRGFAVLNWQAQAGIADLFKMKLVALAQAGFENIIPLHDGVLIGTSATGSELTSQVERVKEILDDSFVTESFDMPVVADTSVTATW